ncbi:MAG TPA: hypothetical protein VKA60_19810 [Blastocatellia bacterium]|nr:hypothetical protein [Blastocatellia bacterium]
MKRFSSNAAHAVADEPGWPRHRAPSEWKYFVLAAAALIGLGIGWLSGKVISGWLPAPGPTMTTAERATPAANPPARDDLQSAPSATAPDDSADAAAWTDERSAANVAQATNGEPARGERRAVRHPRHARGQFLFKPFKVFRKLKIW